MFTVADDQCLRVYNTSPLAWPCIQRARRVLTVVMVLLLPTPVQELSVLWVRILSIGWLRHIHSSW